MRRLLAAGWMAPMRKRQKARTAARLGLFLLAIALIALGPLAGCGGNGGGGSGGAVAVCTATPSAGRNSVTRAKVTGSNTLSVGRLQVSTGGEIAV